MSCKKRMGKSATGLPQQQFIKEIADCTQEKDTWIKPL